VPVDLNEEHVILFDSSGIEVAVQGGVAIPAGTRGVLQVGSDGTTARFVTVDASGRQIAVGAAAAGSPVAGNPVLTAGSDGTNVRTRLVDASGRGVVVGAVAAGGAPAGNPVLVSGSDGSSVRTLLTDAGGRPVAVGAAAAGSAPVGNPVYVGGTDGAVIRGQLLDTAGRNIAVGAAASGAAPAGNPVLVSGSDGTAVRSLLTDTSGRQIAVGAAASGSPVSGAPVLVSGSDGTAVRTLRTDSTGQLYVLGSVSQGDPTWSALASSVVVGSNKSMLSILNETGGPLVVVRIREVWVINAQFAAVTGIIGTFDLLRFTGHSGGTLVTPQTYDTADTLAANVTVRTGATVTGEAAVPLVRRRWSTDEWGAGTLEAEVYQEGIQASTPFWSRSDSSMKAITLRTGEGVHVKFTTASTVGTFDLAFVFTVTAT
jgi:hypothetical protein